MGNSSQVRPVNALVNYEHPEGKQGRVTQQPPVEPQVTFVCFNTDGSRMASVDVRPDIDRPESSFHANLRFWERRGSGETPEDGPLFHVHTDVDRPHRSFPQLLYAS